MFLDTWGATTAEVDGPVPGDHLLPHARLVATRSIDLEAEPSAVFPWLEQIGFGKAGWYSYDWIDNLGRRSADRIHPEWLGLEEGDAVPGGPIHFVASVVDRPSNGGAGAFVLTLPPRTLLGHRIDFVLAFDLRPRDGGTRLVTRVRSTIDGPLGRIAERWLLGPGDGIMVRKQLLNLAERTDRVATVSSI